LPASLAEAVRMRAILVALVLALAGGAAAQETPWQAHRLPPPIGTALLLAPQGAAPPLVILVPDALGADGRHEPYADSLLARGIATLLLGLGEEVDPAALSAAEDPASRPEAVALARGWARDAGFARIGLLGWGAGGRAVLAEAAGLPAAALYPGCAGLALPADGTVLLLHGRDAPGAGDCAAIPPRPALDLRALEAGHGWDIPGAIWPSRGPRVRDPAGSGFIPAATDPAVTLLAAEALAAWFEERLRHWPEATR
jgi:dienelactone hydrolase